MVFLRKKKVKGKNYYYIVKSKLIKGKIKQIVICYLGSPNKIVEVFDFYKQHQKRI